MTTEMIITLCILAFMVVMLLTHKLPYGLTGLICLVAFVLTGVADIPTAFSGFSSSTAIMVAAMIVVASQLGRTSIIHRLRQVLENLQGKGDFVIMITMFVVTILLSQFMGQIACLSIMLMFVQTLDEDSELSPARMLFAVATLNTMWTSKLPIAMGATMPNTINSFFSGVAPDYAIGLFDYMKAALVPGVLGLIYCIVFFRFIPKKKMKKEDVKEVKEQEAISKRDEMIIFGVFAVIMAAFFMSNVKWMTSSIQNILPLAGVLVLILTKVVDAKDVVRTVFGDMIFMIASMSAVSTILSNTGVGTLIGETVLKILGGSPAPIFVITVFTLVTAVMTNFLSNMGTMALMIPIAASTALAGGFNVQTVVLVTSVAAWMAYVLPTGCAGSMIAFGTGNFDTLETLKFTVPLFILQVVSLIISTTLLFPIYN